MSTDMPLDKYRSVYDMPPPGRSNDRELSARIRTAWRRAFSICRPVLERGVRRYRSIAEANEARFRETVDRMRRRAGLANKAGD